MERKFQRYGAGTPLKNPAWEKTDWTALELEAMRKSIPALERRFNLLRQSSPDFRILRNGIKEKQGLQGCNQKGSKSDYGFHRQRISRFTPWCDCGFARYGWILRIDVDSADRETEHEEATD